MISTPRAETVIRAAGAADVDALVAMRVRLQVHLQRSNPEVWHFAAGAEDRLAETYRAWLRDDDRRILVACGEDGVVLGMAVGVICRHEEFAPDRSGRLDDVWVAPEQRGQGITTRMVYGLLDFFRRAGVEVLSLNYVQGNVEAEAVWTRLGFNPVIATAVSTLEETERRLTGTGRASAGSGT